MLLLHIQPEVRAALRDRRPVVALESALITHGLPFPLNVETARTAEAAVRDAGATPATIAVIAGQVNIGLDAAMLASLAGVAGASKAARRDLGPVLAAGGWAGTTVSATLFLAHRAGIRFFATGGIGGVHPESHGAWDVSADLFELARTPIAVVCAGAKSILDIPRTLEALESYGVPVIGYGTDDFPGFYLARSGQPLDVRTDSPAQAAELARRHWQVGGAGLVLAQPPPATLALKPEEWQEALAQAEAQARAEGVRGKRLTPFLLGRLALHSGGKTLRLNHELVAANARLAAEVAVAYAVPPAVDR